MALGLSCGFVVQDVATNLYLCCHPFGRKDNLCDIPKGQIEDGETPIECALRELREETGLTECDFVGDVKTIGRVPYNTKKDLYLFFVQANVDISALRCDSKFEYFGKMVPEMSSYELGSLDRYFPNLKKAIQANL